MEGRERAMDPERGQFSREDWRKYKQSLDIKNRYEDGAPLNPEDKAFVLGLLKRHPKGREKFGMGVRDVIVGEYIMGTRCFFVVRGDGAVEDFSVRKCLGAAASRRNERLLRAMKLFPYGRLQAVYRKRVEAMRRSGFGR